MSNVVDDDGCYYFYNITPSILVSVFVNINGRGKYNA